MDALLTPQDMKKLYEQGYLDVQRTFTTMESNEGFLTLSTKLAAALVGPSRSVGAIQIDPLFLEMIKDPNAEAGFGYTRVRNETLRVLPSPVAEPLPEQTRPVEVPPYTPPPQPRPSERLTEARNEEFEDVERVDTPQTFSDPEPEPLPATQKTINMNFTNTGWAGVESGDHTRNVAQNTMQGSNQNWRQAGIENFNQKWAAAQPEGGNVSFGTVLQNSVTVAFTSPDTGQYNRFEAISSWHRPSGQAQFISSDGTRGVGNGLITSAVNNYALAGIDTRVPTQARENDTHYRGDHTYHHQVDQTRSTALPQGSPLRSEFDNLAQQLGVTPENSPSLFQENGEPHLFGLYTLQNRTRTLGEPLNEVTETINGNSPERSRGGTTQIQNFLQHSYAAAYQTVLNQPLPGGGEGELAQQATMENFYALNILGANGVTGDRAQAFFNISPDGNIQLKDDPQTRTALARVLGNPENFTRQGSLVSTHEMVAAYAHTLEANLVDHNAHRQSNWALTSDDDELILSLTPELTPEQKELARMDTSQALVVESADGYLSQLQQNGEYVDILHPSGEVTSLSRIGDTGFSRLSMVVGTEAFEQAPLDISTLEPGSPERTALQTLHNAVFDNEGLPENLHNRVPRDRSQTDGYSVSNVQAATSNLQSVIDGLPEGNLKDQLQSELTRIQALNGGADGQLVIATGGQPGQGINQTKYIADTQQAIQNNISRLQPGTSNAEEGITMINAQVSRLESMGVDLESVTINPAGFYKTVDAEGNAQIHQGVPPEGVTPENITLADWSVLSPQIQTVASQPGEAFISDTTQAIQNNIGRLANPEVSISNYSEGIAQVESQIQDLQSAGQPLDSIVIEGFYKTTNAEGVSQIHAGTPPEGVVAERVTLADWQSSDTLEPGLKAAVENVANSATLLQNPQSLADNVEFNIAVLSDLIQNRPEKPYHQGAAEAFVAQIDADLKALEESGHGGLISTEQNEAYETLRKFVMSSRIDGATNPPDGTTSPEASFVSSLNGALDDFRSTLSLAFRDAKIDGTEAVALRNKVETLSGFVDQANDRLLTMLSSRGVAGLQSPTANGSETSVAAHQLSAVTAEDLSSAGFSIEESAQILETIDRLGSARASLNVTSEAQWSSNLYGSLEALNNKLDDFGESILDENGLFNMQPVPATVTSTTSGATERTSTTSFTPGPGQAQINYNDQLGVNYEVEGLNPHQSQIRGQSEIYDRGIDDDQSTIADNFTSPTVSNNLSEPALRAQADSFIQQMEAQGHQPQVIAAALRQDLIANHGLTPEQAEDAITLGQTDNVAQTMEMSGEEQTTTEKLMTMLSENLGDFLVGLGQSMAKTAEELKALIDKLFGEVAMRLQQADPNKILAYDTIYGEGGWHGNDADIAVGRPDDYGTLQFNQTLDRTMNASKPYSSNFAGADPNYWQSDETVQNNETRLRQALKLSDDEPLPTALPSEAQLRENGFNPGEIQAIHQAWNAFHTPTTSAVAQASDRYREQFTAG
ncbi:MAG: hypothetical protein IGS03_06185 [Candidatus Sericytochromatia bacterium]|nr:hypothetical protein [Candidatus Sericytochromatia bacterium]